MTRWRQSRGQPTPAPLLALETHGRADALVDRGDENPGEAIDTSDTVGMLSAIYPLRAHSSNPRRIGELLAAVPGLEFVDLEQTRVGYMCNKLAPLPDFKRDYHEAQLQAAADAGVTTLAGVYHACHRDLCSHERDWPFEVVNFLELVGESMGLQRPDIFKRMKIMQDVDAILADAGPMIGVHGLDLEEARDVVLRDMLGEQPLPLRT